ncbi:hypothetical protein ASC97_27625 [Rhizobium sp. Root1203]|nr:hypothetical protein ASC97_27625 [Rhizobium sp. Root1203]
MLGVQRAADFDPDGIMIMLADMPLLKAEDLDTLIGVFRASGAKTIVRAACDGVPDLCDQLASGCAPKANSCSVVSMSIFALTPISTSITSRLDREIIARAPLSPRRPWSAANAERGKITGLLLLVRALRVFSAD